MRIKDWICKVFLFLHQRYMRSDRQLDKRGSGAAAWKNVFLTMKLNAFLFMIAIFSAQAKGMAQTVTISGKNLTLEKIFSAIKKQTGYVVFNNKRDIAEVKPVTLSVSDIPLKDMLDIVFKDQPLKYSIRDKTIFLSRKTTGQSGNSAPEIQPLTISQPHVKIKVVDLAGEPLVGATVSIRKKKVSNVTDRNGFITMDLEVGDILDISFIGYEMETFKVPSTTADLTIVLKPSDKKLDEIVVNAGILTRKKESFTGAVSSFSGTELRKIGNGNVLQSLKTLDPSFIIVPNELSGSNPNQLPTIQLRGTTSIITSNSLKNEFDIDPNQPLFILNGMESSLQQIVNLDINRIASITILKDAASTALYGSKAANGVVVVETKRPRPGDLRVHYTLDMRMEIPDLGDYNMMNSSELLEFQKLAGYYAPGERQASQLPLDTLYNNRLRAVLGGVDSYWLSVPLRNAYTAGHAISINGGSGEFQYDAMVTYRKAPGVMKGSQKETWGGSIDLSYRRKKVNFVNRTYVEGNQGQESPYGTFADYVNVAPYYRKYDDKGRLFTGKYLETFIGNDGYYSLLQRNTPNPIYNAMLNSKNGSSGLRIQNNLSFIWDINHDWRFTSGILIAGGTADNAVFMPAAHTMFDNVSYDQKGSYQYGGQKSLEYQGNIMLTYQRVFNEKHSLTGNVRTEMAQQARSAVGFTAAGFPDGVEPNPAFATGYALNSKPTYAEIKTRQVNALSSVNYAFANKYYADATLRIDGSTVFGSQKKYTHFWALGIGWTINNESFLKNAGWLSLLRLRGNAGTNGNQQLGTFVSSSVYDYTNQVTGFGTGLYLNQLGVPDLAWQTTRSYSAGIDLAVDRNRFIATLNAFNKITDPLIVNAPAAASVGVSSYALNAGQLTVKGLEGIIKYSPIFNLRERLQWTLGLTGSITRSRFSKFSSILEKENELARKEFNQDTPLEDIAGYLRRYLDGYSPDDMWAVRSLGIDPATGKEILVKKDGTHTFYYNANDETVVGSSMPKVQGIISSNLTIKNFSFSVNLRYSLGQSKFNYAVFNKVENITSDKLSFNQDKRALYDRWKQPGDKAMFSGINLSDLDYMYNMYAPPSSRFIQKENYLSGESIMIGYELSAASQPWLQKLSIRSVILNAYANEVFRLSNITAERGTDYPFAKNYSLSLNVFF